MNVKELIEAFLVSHAEGYFTYLQIAEALNVPQPSVRKNIAAVLRGGADAKFFPASGRQYRFESRAIDAFAVGRGTPRRLVRAVEVPAIVERTDRIAGEEKFV